MSTKKLVAVVLIVLGALGLAYGGFTYTKDTHTAEIGALQLQLEEKSTSTFRSGPDWAPCWWA